MWGRVAGGLVVVAGGSAAGVASDLHVRVWLLQGLPVAARRPCGPGVPRGQPPPRRGPGPTRGRLKEVRLRPVARPDRGSARKPRAPGPGEGSPGTRPG